MGEHLLYDLGEGLADERSGICYNGAQLLCDDLDSAQHLLACDLSGLYKLGGQQSQVCIFIAQPGEQVGPGCAGLSRRAFKGICRLLGGCTQGSHGLLLGHGTRCYLLCSLFGSQAGDTHLDLYRVDGVHNVSKGVDAVLDVFSLLGLDLLSCGQQPLHLRLGAAKS